MYRHIISRQSQAKEKAKKKLPHTTLFDSATVQDFEEARELKSGEESNESVRDEIKMPYKG